MTKVLVADDERDIRELLVDTLADWGYEVIQASDGGTAFELASAEHPDIILLDIWMPVMDGFQVLKRLRKNPATELIPVVMVTGLPAAEGERAGMNLGVVHYITKPWEPGTVEAVVRVALREAGALTGEVTHDPDSDDPEAKAVVRTGNTQMDRNLGGGIPLGSLTLVEGIPSAGKSVLCQHITYEALLDGLGVAYLSSEHSTDSLVRQMGSLGKDVSGYCRAGQLGVYPVEEPSTDGNPECGSDPGRLLAILGAEIERLPGHYGVIICDDITNLASSSSEMAIMALFTSCKRLCDGGRTIIISARSYAFEEKMLSRLQVACDAHLSLRAEQIGAKMVKMLEVRKVRNAELSTNNTVSFEVVSGKGLLVVPGSKVKI